MIAKLLIQNFKSIQSQNLELGSLNVLIGPNGSGKSNLVSLFRLLEQIGEQRLQQYVFQSGGAEVFLFGGYEVSSSIQFAVEFDQGKDPDLRGRYSIHLISDGESLKIANETVRVWDQKMRPQVEEPDPVYSLSPESSLTLHAENRLARYVQSYLKNIRVFHFHDTSENAALKLPQPIDEVDAFHPEGENLAPLLLLFQEKYPGAYRRIVETIQLVYPFFLDFVLTESPNARGKVALKWKEKTSGQVFHARQISDGTLRFICLVTLLLQPPDTNFVPHTIILDEPELGLHPFALQILAELMQKAAQDRQLIVATQSVSLINYFQPEDLLITERGENGATQFRRLKDKNFESWLEEYSLGQLWERNLLGGRP